MRHVQYQLKQPVLIDIFMDYNAHITSCWFTKMCVLSSQLLVLKFIPQLQI